MVDGEHAGGRIPGQDVVLAADARGDRRLGWCDHPKACDIWIDGFVQKLVARLDHPLVGRAWERRHACPRSRKEPKR